MSNPENKVVLICGAGLPIGREIAMTLAGEGRVIVLNDLTPINLNKLVSDIQAAGEQACAYPADIASKLALQTMLNQILDTYGQIDILINCAGIEPTAPLLEMDEWAWRRTIDYNLTGGFLLMQSVGRVMASQFSNQRKGTIINIVSLPLGQSQVAAAASKSGLLTLTRGVAAELQASNVRVFGLCKRCPEAETQPGLPDNLRELVSFLCSLTPENPTDFLLDNLQGKILKW